MNSGFHNESASITNLADHKQKLIYHEKEFSRKLTSMRDQKDSIVNESKTNTI